MDSRLRPDTVMLSCEFRPSGSLSLSFFTRLTLVQRKLCPHWVLGPLGLVVFWCVFWVGCLFPVSCCSPLTNMQSFHPSYDDLGTPPTWRPHSWKKIWTALAGVTFECWQGVSLFWWVTKSKLLISMGGRATLSLTHSLGQGSCAATAAIAWQGKWQTHFPLHKSPAIWFFGLGVL